MLICNCLSSANKDSWYNKRNIIHVSFWLTVTWSVDWMPLEWLTLYSACLTKLPACPTDDYCSKSWLRYLRSRTVSIFWTTNPSKQRRNRQPTAGIAIRLANDSRLIRSRSRSIIDGQKDNWSTTQAIDQTVNEWRIFLISPIGCQTD